MSQPIPFVVYSDGPRLPTGLARITRDLCTRLYAEQEALGIALLQVGYDPLPGPATTWPLYSGATLDTEGDWGAGMVDAAWQNYFGDLPGILFSIWDPGRAFPLLGVKAAEQKWGYFPVDATNVNGTLGGPAAETIRRYDRVLAYGRWGSLVLRPLRGEGVSFLPHGIDLDTFTYVQTQESLGVAEQVMHLKAGEVVIGCVATNQPRKDLGLYFATLAELRKRGHKVRGWLHTDRMVRAWAIQQLVEDFGLAKKVSVTLSLGDAELSACYSVCGATIAPGLGEGFGYPIVESMACGTPCIHVDYGGGAELLPLNAWRVPFMAERLEGLYAVRRPVVDPKDMANAVERALDWKRQDERVCQAYCRGQVEYLKWDHLWPRWRAWFRQGLEEL
jgi:glycosyltransferase involved in cell wall biosynthesis